MDLSAIEGAVRQLTFDDQPHVLTNVNAFSCDGDWIAYDIRSNGGDVFDGDRIERVNVHSGERQVLYRGRNGANVGVVTCNPVADEHVFIEGPEDPTPDFTYGFSRRHGVIVDALGRHRNLDARHLSPPFTPGALRGGTHVHVFDPTGRFVSSTYEDEVLRRLGSDIGAHDRNQRTIAVTVLDRSVRIRQPGLRDRNGAFTAVVVATTNQPRPGSDEVQRAIEEGWVGTDGYATTSGRQRALAFQGEVVRADGTTMFEVFLVDLPDDLTRAAGHPLEGTATRRPAPPAGCVQRRLTFTQDRRFPGIQGPRHWLRSSPDGQRIACLMKDDDDVVQLFTVSPLGRDLRQLTRNRTSIASAFTWSSNGRWIAHTMDGHVCITDTESGRTCTVTPRFAGAGAPRPQACVFSPDGRRIAFLRPTPTGDTIVDQIWLAELPGSL